MASHQERLTNSPKPQLLVPPAPWLLLFCLWLGWLALAPILSGILTLFLPAAWSGFARSLLPILLVTGALFFPALALIGLARRRGGRTAWLLALTSLAISFYISLATGIRAVSGADSNFETILRLIGLTLIVTIIGGLGLRQVGVPRDMFAQVLGLNHPSLAALLLTITLIALITIGWPLTGALGDSWMSQLLLIRTLALTLPEEIFFRGVVLGMLTFTFQHRKPLAVVLALLAYLAFIPSQIVPHNDWLKLLLIIPALPLALIVTELRALTGSIWAGILLAWLYRATPLLFTDPRDELPLIGYPWQAAAYVWMMAGAGALALILWLGRRFLIPRCSLSRRATISLALAAALFSWLGWGGLWVGLGYAGFHDDGFLIIMAEQADLSGAETIADPVDRRRFVRDRLVETAERTQAPLRAALEAAGLTYRPFYLINMIRVEGHQRRMADFAGLPGVERVILNPNVRPYPASKLGLGYGSTPNEGQGIGWNIEQTQADAVWEIGITGQGVVVGGQDTGYDWEHPALRRAYRGAVTDQVDHRYNWHDAWSEALAPFDDDQHGTHTMGTILGDDGSGNRIGMAPGARWIGCRNMRRGLGNPASYTDCMEFFLAPYPLGGDPFTEGEVTLAPHVVNNSWGCPDIEGCDDAVLGPAVEALRAAGIMMVVSAGNSGPVCQTVSEPPARYDSVFSVGATNRGGQITGFSSRGPVPDTILLKPDVAAPGSDIRSSLPGGRYGSAEGTSMAGPHVAGLVALIWSANPKLIGRIDATEEIIRRSATPVEVGVVCPTRIKTGGEPSLLEQIEAMENPMICACGEVTGWPNNVYGWGEINALEAVELALEYGQ